MTIHPFEYDRDAQGQHPCCICGKATDGARMVELNHETGDWPGTEDDEDSRSLYHIGPDCARRVKAQGINIIEGETA